MDRNQHDRHHHHLEGRLHAIEKHLRNGGAGYAKDDENREGFVYAVNPANLAAAGQSTTALQIDGFSAFELQQIIGYAEANGGTVPQADNICPQLTLQITDGAENRQLFQIPLPFGLVCGSSRLPFVLPRARIFNPNQSVNITIANFAAVTYNNIFVGLVGDKIYLDGKR